MSRTTGLVAVVFTLAVLGAAFADDIDPLQNGSFDSGLAGWTLFPEPNPDPAVEEEYVSWDEDAQAAVLLPYGADKGLATTYTRLSQQFSVPQESHLLCFDISMNTLRPGFETDVLTVTLNGGTTVYELTSSQVNEAAQGDDPHVTAKYIDPQGQLQYAVYKTTVWVNLAGVVVLLDDDDHEGDHDDDDHEGDHDDDDHEGDHDDDDHVGDHDDDDHEGDHDDDDHEGDHDDDDHVGDHDDDDHEGDDHGDDDHEGDDDDDCVTLSLEFQLKNDNLDNCISSVSVDNVQVVGAEDGHEDGDLGDDDHGDDDHDDDDHGDDDHGDDDHDD